VLLCAEAVAQMDLGRELEANRVAHSMLEPSELAVHIEHVAKTLAAPCD
jgi:hypothetical protein